MGVHAIGRQALQSARQFVTSLHCQLFHERSTCYQLPEVGGFVVNMIGCVNSILLLTKNRRSEEKGSLGLDHSLQEYAFLHLSYPDTSLLNLVLLALSSTFTFNPLCFRSVLLGPCSPDSPESPDSEAYTLHTSFVLFLNLTHVCCGGSG